MGGRTAAGRADPQAGRVVAEEVGGKLDAAGGGGRLHQRRQPDAQRTAGAGQHGHDILPPLPVGRIDRRRYILGHPVGQHDPERRRRQARRGPVDRVVADSKHDHLRTSTAMVEV